MDTDTVNYFEKQKAPLSSVILCAGRSSRMGQEKGLLEINGFPILGRLIMNLHEYSESIAIVVNENNYEALRLGLLEHNIKWYGVHFIINKNADKGMFTSIKTGLESAAENKPSLIHLIDQPFISEVTYDALEESLDDEHLIFQPSVKVEGNLRAGHPIIIQPEVREYLLTLPDDANLRSALKKYRDKIKYVEAKDDAILNNINTLEEFELRLKEYRKKYGNTNI